MPKKGYSKITVSNALKGRLRRTADSEGLSMPGLIAKMLGAQYPEYPIPEGVEEREK